MCRQLGDDDLSTSETNKIQLTLTYMITFDFDNNCKEQASRTYSHFTHEKLRFKLNDLCNVPKVIEEPDLKPSLTKVTRFFQLQQWLPRAFCIEPEGKYLRP